MSTFYTPKMKSQREISRLRKRARELTAEGERLAAEGNLGDGQARLLAERISECYDWHKP